MKNSNLLHVPTLLSNVNVQLLQLDVGHLLNPIFIKHF